MSARNGLRLAGEGDGSNGAHARHNPLEELELAEWDRVRLLLERRADGVELTSAELVLLVRASEAFSLEPHAATFRLELYLARRRELELE